MYSIDLKTGNVIKKKIKTPPTLAELENQIYEFTCECFLEGGGCYKRNFYTIDGNDIQTDFMKRCLQHYRLKTINKTKSELDYIALGVFKSHATNIDNVISSNIDESKLLYGNDQITVSKGLTDSIISQKKKISNMITVSKLNFGKKIH